MTFTRKISHTFGIRNATQHHQLFQSNPSAPQFREVLTDPNDVPSKLNQLHSSTVPSLFFTFTTPPGLPRLFHRQEPYLYTPKMFAGRVVVQLYIPPLGLLILPPSPSLIVNFIASGCILPRRAKKKNRKNELTLSLCYPLSNSLQELIDDSCRALLFQT